MLYPPAVRGMAPPVRLGRSVFANGARPENEAIRRDVFEEGSLDLSNREAPVRSELIYRRTR